MAQVQNISTGYVPRPWQTQVHLGLHAKRWGVLVVHRRGGKTVLAVSHLIDRALKLKLSDGRLAYLAPKLNQAKAIAWFYLKRYTEKIPGVRVSESELHITLPNGAQIRIHGADNPDSLRGLYKDEIVLDEAADLPKDLWESVLRPQLSDREGGALFMGTPKGVNLLSEMYFKALERDDFYAGLFNVYQTNNAISEKEQIEIKRDMGENAFRREFLCDFSASAANVLLSLEQVETAAKRHYNEGDFQHAARVIGVDVARQGDDSTVIIRRQGLVSWAPVEIRGADAMTVADRVAFEINEWQPDAVFVDGTGGYGAGVIDRLRQLRHRVIEVQFAATPNKPVFLNKRAEMWWEMAEWVREAGAIPNHQRLKQDLCTPTYDYTSAGKMQLESKDDMRTRGMPSSDFADALAVTFAAKIMPSGFRPEIELPPVRRTFDSLARVRHLI